MEYFILTQDRRINVPKLPAELIKAVPKLIVSTSKVRNLTDAMAFPIQNNQDGEYPAVIDQEVYLVNTQVKDVLGHYDWKLASSPTMFNDMHKGQQHLYWVLDIKTVDCLADETIFNPNRTLRKLVLNERKVIHIPMFKIGGILEEYVAVRLDVAESLLRRDIYGIELKPILTNNT